MKIKKDERFQFRIEKLTNYYKLYCNEVLVYMVSGTLLGVNRFVKDGLIMFYKEKMYKSLKIDFNGK